ncbi:MAG: hypothetical protein NZ889_01650 [Candidatus Pacearchaeota archaeon]|nr:hypothetical protein [Candidatus Pacearchaeota archaeon]
MKLVIAVVLSILLLSLLTFGFLSTLALERKSPNEKIEEEKILVFDDKVVINVKGAKLVSYSNTNSMDPLLDENAKGIEIKPSAPEQIKVGDIISYKKGKEIISHRVVEVGKDEKGWFCKTKGDNNLFLDGKIRFEQIVGVLVIVIY